MRMLSKVIGVLGLVSVTSMVHGTAAAGQDTKLSPTAETLPLTSIKLPPGFEIALFARVPDARSLALGQDGTVFVGTRKKKVFAVRDDNGDFKADRVVTVANDLVQPNGVAFKDGALYIAEIHKISKLAGIEGRLDRLPPLQTVSASFPTDEHHGWKFIAFGPDGKLYVPVGAPCNICKSDGRYAALFRMNADGSGKEVFATGIRNTVGFDWHPGTKELWFTDNGRDLLGDDVPPDELNRAAKAGLDFGYPYCHAGDLVDPELGKPGACKDPQKPEVRLTPHSAALGMRFYQGKMFPAPYQGAIFLAQHGSWNRSKPIGYQLSTVAFKDGKAQAAEPFATGWLKADGKVWGRPVDVLMLPDGSMLVSDDHAGAVYRISYKARS